VLRKCARENEVILSIGIIEKEGGTLYCTAILIGKDGELLHRHRKVCKPGIREKTRGIEANRSSLYQQLLSG
jgi:predicted amidohydrolase